MSQQNLDVRRSIQIVRRRRKLFGSVAVLGFLIGAAYAVLTPPMLSSTALVVISGMPSGLTNPASTPSTTGIDTSLATQIVLASSGPVLAGALPKVSPPTNSVQALDKRISVAAVGGSDVLSITATGKTADEAESTANAVANSYIKYVTGSKNLAVQATAKMVEPATTATGPKLAEHIGIYAVLGILAGMLVGFVICLALERSDRRLVERDAIANSIAVPVLASIPVERPSDPASWARLLEEYQPDAVHAYGLGKLLRQFGVGGYDQASGSVNAPSLTVLSLASDPTALALGPQLAAFASAQGIPTALVVGPQQDMNVAASLHTTCAAGAQMPSGGGKPLRLLVTEDDQAGAAFTVVVVVVDARDPHVPPMAHTTATLLGVSAGGATAEELARAATAVATEGSDIYGILVANPDAGDQTTGRIPRLPPVQRALPTRVNGLATEIRR